jgi:CHAT domain
MALSLDLDQNLTNIHVSNINKRLTDFSVLKQESRNGVARALAEPRLELVYFCCHGRRDLLPGTNATTPYLEVGKQEGISPSDITAWDVSDWDKKHWRETSPLVVINGCHTAEISPESLVNFVDAFIGVYASGVIGTEVILHQQMAGEAAEELLSRLSKYPVGEALRQMRLHFLRKGNLLGLAYTPYCSADLGLAH